MKKVVFIERYGQDAYDSKVELDRERSQKWREDNPDYMRDWRKNHPEHDLEYYHKNKEKINEQRREHYHKNKEHMLEQKREYYVDNKKHILEQQREQHVKNRDRDNELSREYRAKNKEKINEHNREYYHDNKERMCKRVRAWQKTTAGKDSDRRKYAKRKKLGFEPINEPFEGCEGHHIDNKAVIYIPAELHRSVWHCVSSGRGMHEINTLSWGYMLGDEYNETI